MIEVYEGVVHRKKIKVFPFRKVIHKLFALRQKKVKMKINMLCKNWWNFYWLVYTGSNLEKIFEEKFACNSEYWMMSEYDERVKEFWRLWHGNYIVKLVDDAGSEDEVKKLNTMPLDLGAFVLNNSKRNMNNFIHAIFGFYTNVHYGDTDSLYIGNEH